VPVDSIEGKSYGIGAAGERALKNEGTKSGRVMNSLATAANISCNGAASSRVPQWKENESTRGNLRRSAQARFRDKNQITSRPRARIRSIVNAAKTPTPGCTVKRSGVAGFVVSCHREQLVSVDFRAPKASRVSVVD